MALDTIKRSSSTVDLTHYRENLHEKKMSMLARAHTYTHTYIHTHTQHKNYSNNVVTERGTKAGRILISVKFH
jgi:hypothetical protein